MLRPGLMVRANALHYALLIRTLLSTMQRFGVLRERQVHTNQWQGFRKRNDAVARYAVRCTDVPHFAHDERLERAL